VLGEFGIIRCVEGEAQKCAMLRWQIEHALFPRWAWPAPWCSASRTIGFATDAKIGGLEMGITTANRQPKESFRVVQKMFRARAVFFRPGLGTRFS